LAVDGAKGPDRKTTMTLIDMAFLLFFDVVKTGFLIVNYYWAMGV
jgi:hypothetical protein